MPLATSTPKARNFLYFSADLSAWAKTPASITALTRDQMVAYHARRYVAPNILAAAAGKFDWDRFVELVASACGSWEKGPVGRDCVPGFRGGLRLRRRAAGLYPMRGPGPARQQLGDERKLLRQTDAREIVTPDRRAPGAVAQRAGGLTRLRQHRIQAAVRESG